jgi:hypothetical protein
MNRSDKAEIVRALRKEGAHYNEIASVLGCSSSTVGDLLWDPDGSKARYRVNAPPHTTVVMRVFGSWNNAIKAAGFEPRRVGSRGPDRGKRRTAA